MLQLIFEKQWLHAVLLVVLLHGQLLTRVNQRSWPFWH